MSIKLGELLTFKVYRDGSRFNFKWLLSAFACPGWFVNQSVLIHSVPGVTNFNFNALGFATTNSYGWWRIRGYHGESDHVK